MPSADRGRAAAEPAHDRDPDADGELLQKRNFEKMAVATLEPGFPRILNLALVGTEGTHSLLSVVVYLVIAKSLVPHALARTLGSRVSCPLESEVFWGCVLTDGGLLPATGAATGVPLAALPGKRQASSPSFTSAVYSCMAEHFLLLSPASAGRTPTPPSRRRPRCWECWAPSPDIPVSPLAHLDLHAHSCARLRSSRCCSTLQWGLQLL